MQQSSKSTNPLKLLSEKLGSQSKALSMEKIAQLTGVASGTLRSIELGLRKFSPEIQQRMRQRGLEWDLKTGQWFFTYDHKAELSLYLIETFRRLSRGDRYSQDLDAHAACEKVLSLLHGVAAGDYTNLLLDLHAALERLCQTYKVEGSQKLFAERSLRYWLQPTKSGGKVLVKGFSSSNFPEELLNFSDQRKSDVSFEEDERRQTDTATQPAA